MDDSELHEAMGKAGLDPCVGQVLQFFQSQLSDVAFANVGAGSLAQEAGAVAERVRDVEHARAQLRAAEAALTASKQVLLRSAEMALEYARIYATGDADLTRALEAIVPRRLKQHGSAPRRKPGASRRPAGEGTAQSGGEATAEQLRLNPAGQLRASLAPCKQVGASP